MSRNFAVLGVAARHRAVPTALALAAATVLGASAARADMEFVLEFTGYSDLFKECEFTISVNAPDTYAHVVLGYSVNVEGKGTQSCEVAFGPDRVAETSCHSDQAFHTTCEDKIVVKPVALDCYGTDDLSTDCGAISLTGPDGAFVFE